MKHFFIAVLAMLVASVSHAHPMLVKTTPSDGVVLPDAPHFVVFAFNDAIRLTRVTTRHEGGGPIDMSLAEAGFDTDHSIGFSGTDSGAYLIEWRGLGGDGHALQGTFSFKVD